MKKISIFVLTAMLLICMVACGRKAETTMPEDTTPQTGKTSEDMPTVARNVPDPEVNDNSTGNKDTTTDHNDKGILDDTMDKITGQK